MADQLRARIQALDLGAHIRDVVVPTERLTEIRSGTKSMRERVASPGIVFVQMVLDDVTSRCVRETPGILAFVSESELTDQEVNQILTSGLESRPGCLFGWLQDRSQWKPMQLFSGVLDIRANVSRFDKESFQGKWDERNVLNAPGPFYGAATDTCCCGPQVAPDNVLVDPDGQEFLFRQPHTLKEMLRVLDAAVADPFSGYGADGNHHWSLGLIREWWKRRDEMQERMKDPWLNREYPRSVSLWKDWWDTGLEGYLRAYAFFVDEHRLPAVSDRLPEV